MKKPLLIPALILTASTILTISLPASAETCQVQDLNGRKWTWTATNNACAGALQACRTWHKIRQIRDYRCDLVPKY